MLVPASLLLASTSPSLDTTALAQAMPEATASAFSYSFVQLGYSRTDVDGFDDDADSVNLAISYSVAPKVFVFAGFGFSAIGVYIIDLGTGDVVGQDDIESTTVSFGAGFHQPLGERTDFVADLSIGRVESDLDALGLSDSTTLWNIEAGVRHLLDDRIEVNGFLELTDGSDVESEFGIALGGRFHATPAFSIGIGLGAFEDSTSIGASIRYQW